METEVGGKDAACPAGGTDLKCCHVMGLGSYRWYGDLDIDSFYTTSMGFLMYKGGLFK